MAAARSASQGVPLSALNPKFLHANSTSHTWPFSAIAELIDNAYDPDVNARQIWIDKTLIKDHICLTFTDDGRGMNLDKLHKMLSFGFSDKVAINGHVPVGLYGNGFKSGSMRLGKDAMVFTKNGDTFSVGVLSQSYLEAIKAENVIVPIINFNQKKKLSQNFQTSLKAILQYSLFSTEKELLTELEAISGKQGTKIIIWNIRQTNDGKPEFDFETDKYDFRIPEDILDENNESKKYKRQERKDQIVPDSDYSLRAYCSILYLKPRMQIVIRGKKVKTQLISRSLAHIEHDLYRPTFSLKNIKITFGFNCKIKEHYGIMMYHKNRLIKAYEKVGCQLRANNMGVGVIGVIACDFLKPTHNKQDFDYTNDYRLTIAALGQKLNDYWYEKKHKRNEENPESFILVEDEQNDPDQVWVQCDSCLKWRKLPDGITSDNLPDKWFCINNPDPQFRNCTVPEEPEDVFEFTPSYEKTYKKQEQKNREKNRQKSLNLDKQHLEEQLQRKEQELEEEKKRQQFDAQQNADLQNIIKKISREAESLRKEQALLQRRLQAKNVQVNSTTVRPPTLVVDGSLGLEINDDTATTSTANSNSPVSSLQIVDVKSLSADCPSTKRKIMFEAPSPSSKRLKVDEGRNLSTSANEEIVDCTTSGEDDLIILDERSTPRPKLSLDLSRVKVEQRESTDQTGFVTDDQYDSDVQVVTNSSEQKSSGTQTENSTVSVKEEVSSNNLNPGDNEEARNHPNSEGLEKNADNRSEQEQLKNDTFRCTVEERDRYKAKSELLQRQLERLEKQLAEQSTSHVKKETCHQRTSSEFVINGDQAEEVNHFCRLPTEEQTSRYELAIKEIKRLTEKCEALENLKTEFSTGEKSEPVIKGEEDELILQLDDMFRQLDGCTSERDQYKAEVENLQRETEAMKSQSENLSEEVKRLKDEAIKAQSNLSEDPSVILRALRINIGQLLLNIVPGLDLEQINYDSNVVDEILDQVLTANAS
ncbi:MORC family CW-type zinc finger protein 3b isoform X2 [Callorhinchus milii]|uniref:MORC family CW-type zinc finger protein 3b isoform X2 n=1 Tax=Callorhinchus milii TaxID=7868 RepID=UPI000457299D|nr:MORC family CW-type zinc finger protein 3b isoform X2 [Callorhinchus milii]|eukprot:gi/632975273/ref/XP_007904139.1/ PREDICTED: MORC family CW-type zinc finger protein 3 isoform X2 [Callorhinchus milii]